MNNMNFSLLSDSETLHQLATIGLYYLNFVSNEQSIDSNLVKKYYGKYMLPKYCHLFYL
jgi:hypothetical protein